LERLGKRNKGEKMNKRNEISHQEDLGERLSKKVCITEKLGGSHPLSHVLAFDQFNAEELPTRMGFIADGNASVCICYSMYSTDGSTSSIQGLANLSCHM